MSDPKASPIPTPPMLSPPFLDVSGVLNIRDVGGYSTSEAGVVKKGALFRSGELTNITVDGAEKIFGEMGVKKVFDLRRKVEVKRLNDGKEGMAWNGVEIVRSECWEEEGGWDEGSVEEMLKGFARDPAGMFQKTYIKHLEDYSSTFERILHYLASPSPVEPCVVHCTAGKDRTGIFTAILLSLLGVSNTDIINDYALSTIGTAPAYTSQLAEKLQRHPVWKANWEGVLNLGKSEAETMKIFLEWMEDQYGGVEGWVSKCTNLNAEDVARIRKNLMVSSGGGMNLEATSRSR